MISTFIWNKKTARIHKTCPQSSKLSGGLVLPNFLHYYWVANITKLSVWLSALRDDVGPVWSIMELHSTLPVSPVSFTCFPLPSNLPLNNYVSNPVVQNTIQMWFQLRRHFNFKQSLSFAPITSNPLFTLAQIDPTFKLWLRKGITFFKDLYVNNSFVSFDTLVKNFGIPNFF